jgi:hypothetical protein
MPATLAAKLAAVAVLLGGAGVLAQPPGYQPLNYRMQQAQQQGGQQNGQQNYQPANGLPLPPGYRPRTPPPQYQPQTPQPTATSGAMPGSGGGGTVMYFQKPADALTATGGSGAAAASPADGVAQLNDPNRVQPIPVPVADVPGGTLPLPPPPPPSRYLPPPGGAADRAITPPITRPELAVPPAVAVAPGGGLPPVPSPVYSAQPDMQPKMDTLPKGDVPPYTANKKQMEPRPVDPKYIQLPPRESIFTVYNDAQLEKAVMERLRQDLLEAQMRQFETDNKRKMTPEEQRKYLEAQEKYLVFPPLPVLSPPGIAYKPKTAAYEPRKLIVEPNYVVHRRLHFEEKNAERTGWDLGPAQTLISAAYFWKDTLLLPQSLASGCVYGFWDTSAGKCLPGSPSPYYLYPPGLTVTGTVVEGAVITGGFFLFP